MMRRFAIWLVAVGGMFMPCVASAQEIVALDTIFDSTIPSDTVITNLEPLKVVTNKFNKNWFVLGNIGVHTFRGDYSNVGSFKGTLSPEYSVGLGKWFTPGIGVKLEFIKSNSRGYTEYLKGHYGYGTVLTNSDGVSYRKTENKFWDLSANAMFNITRMICGYEGYNSKKNMNQFLVNIGLGMVHHGEDDNELSAHAELQYSRYFTRSKRVSLDLKLRALLYESNFDLEYGQADYSAKKVDYNFGPQIGITVNLGSMAKTSWEKAKTEIYRRDFREHKVVMERKDVNKLEYGTLTFYVFFPNNYSGRDDAPQVADAPVNAIDYLASGIFTQKRFGDNGLVAANLVADKSLEQIPILDIATQKADSVTMIADVARGYEMDSVKLSLDTDSEHMTAFRNAAGYYYAPIYDGNNVWHYRIDEVAHGQQLLDKDNYKETESFGLNAHRGLDIIRENMDVDKSDLLVSFADVYAAMNSGRGYIAQFSDSATVEHVRHILNDGYITMIQTEGLSTSQDNYTGDDADLVTKSRNSALSQNRAKTVIEWLKSKDKLNNVSSQIYMVNHVDNGISHVDQQSTRGLEAKLNRCTKVRIHYMYEEKK